MGKECDFITEIKLAGDRAKAFLQSKKASSIEQDIQGNFVIGFFKNEHIADTPLGEMFVLYSLVEETNNREVNIFSDKLRKKGSKRKRTVSVNAEGFGKQQVTNGVDIIVQTTAPATLFEIYRR